MKNINTNLFTYNVGSNFDVVCFESEVIGYGWSMDDVLISSFKNEFYITYDVSVWDGDILIEMLVECGMLVVF